MYRNRVQRTRFPCIETDSPQALAVVAYSTSEEDSEPDSEYDLDPEIQTIYTSQLIIVPLTNPTLIAQVHLLLDIYSKPIPVIALFDTGAATTILHPQNFTSRILATPSPDV